MKTHFRDFSMRGTTLTENGGRLEEIIDNRQGRFGQTVVYSALKAEIEDLIGKIQKHFPETKKDLGDLWDAIISLECQCWSAAYRDGMSDIMTAITLNNLGLTKVEYVDYPNKST